MIKVNKQYEHVIHGAIKVQLRVTTCIILYDRPVQCSACNYKLTMQRYDSRHSTYIHVCH
jgi:hypothetical protein